MEQSIIKLYPLAEEHNFAHQLLRSIKTCRHALLRCLRNRKQYQQLLQLNDHQLQDIGISREQARKVINRPCWRL